MIYECYFNFDRKIHQDNLRKSLVSILIKTSENVSLRMLNDEIKSKEWFAIGRYDPCYMCHAAKRYLIFQYFRTM